MIRLNLGAGPDLLPDWTNQDIRWDCGADLVCSADDLPSADCSVDELRAMDLAEHFPVMKIPALFAEWHRVLKPGGTLTMRVPNLQKLCEYIVQRADDPERLPGLIENLYGGHKYGPDGCYDTHHWGWTPASLHATLDEAGFDVLDTDEAPNMTVTARRR